MNLPDWVKPGVKFCLDFGPDNINSNRAYEVRAVVDDRAVIREWWKNHRRWNYTVEDAFYFIMTVDHIKVINDDDTSKPE